MPVSDPSNHISPADLDDILCQTTGLWEELRKSRIFIAGGTGFFGKWLLESLLAANDEFALGASITLLSRRPSEFALKAPHLARHTAVRIIEGDVRNFIFPEGNFTHLIHGAVDASLKMIRTQPLLIFDTIIQGTRRVLDFCTMRGVKKALFISSGAVYGHQPPDIARLTEDYRGAPDFSDRYAVYGEALRAAEMLCLPYATDANRQIKIARCFAFIGPHLPLDMHFAIGNFIRDALNGNPIHIEGDGTPRRSYLYAADLAVWLWTILLRGKNMRAYNVGSEHSVSMAETARLVAEYSGRHPPVTIGHNTDASGHSNIYLPSTRRAQSELNLKETVPLPAAIQRTIEFYRPLFKQ